MQCEGVSWCIALVDVPVEFTSWLSSRLGGVHVSIESRPSRVHVIIKFTYIGGVPTSVELACCVRVTFYAVEILER